MRQINPKQPELLHNTLSTMKIEAAAKSQLPPHTLMIRAGLAVAKLAQALAPHAQSIWVACGPGNNGGDGLMAATQLFKEAKRLGLGRSIHITLAGDPRKLPIDATHALQQALSAGLQIALSPPQQFDFAIDALLGIGASRAPDGDLAKHLELLRHCKSPVLCIDLPTGLLADSGVLLPNTETPSSHAPRHTLSLLTLKPGLFTASGRDAAGDIWFDELCQEPHALPPPTALLTGFAEERLTPQRLHTAHKGSNGSVTVIGGQGIIPTGMGMTGAGVLAARAAIRSGAGRVHLCLLNSETQLESWDPQQPEVMLRTPSAVLDERLLESSTVVCGCGGGSAIVALITPALSMAEILVLDADALNAIAQDIQLQTLLRLRRDEGRITVITPHPLEAARLLSTTTIRIMEDRLGAAQKLAEKFGVICVLKGSGTIIHAEGETPMINASGNGALATAGTGDVLAGMLGAALATRATTTSPMLRTAQAVFEHGRLADAWVVKHPLKPLCADQLTKT